MRWLAAGVAHESCREKRPDFLPARVDALPIDAVSGTLRRQRAIPERPAELRVFWMVDRAVRSKQLGAGVASNSQSASLTLTNRPPGAASAIPTGAAPKASASLPQTPPGGSASG